MSSRLVRMRNLPIINVHSLPLGGSLLLIGLHASRRQHHWVSTLRCVTMPHRERGVLVLRTANYPASLAGHLPWRTPGLHTPRMEPAAYLLRTVLRDTLRLGSDGKADAYGDGSQIWL